MAKNTQDIGADNWLYIATDAVARCIAAGGDIDIQSTPAGIVVRLRGIKPNDGRIHEAFRGHVANVIDGDRIP